MPALVMNQAESVSTNAITGTTINITTGDGSLFPVIANEFDYFYVRIGTDETNVVAKIISRTNDTLIAEALNYEFSIGTPIKLTVCAELLSDYQTYYYQVSAVTVGAAGDFATLSDFLVDFDEVHIKPGQSMDISIVGVLSESLNSASFKTPKQLHIAGAITSIGVTSIQSSSGTSGNYSVILNVSSITNLEVGQVVGISADVISGGTNPHYLYGAHKITNVDAVNTRITLNSKNKGVPSGAVTGTIKVFRTVLNGIVIGSEGFGSLSDIAIDAPGNYGLQFSGSNYISSIAIVNADIGILNDGNLSISSSFISDCVTGISNSGHLSFFEGTLTACDTAVYQYNGYSSIVAQIHSCEEGLQITDHSTSIINDTTLQDTTGIALQVSRYAYVKAANMTLSGNGTDYSPALNTQGNKFGYIDDGT